MHTSVIMRGTSGASVGVGLGHRPFDVGRTRCPADGQLVSEKVEHEFFEQRGQPATDKIAKAARPASSIGQPVFVDELAHVKEKGVDAVVPVELHASEVHRAQVHRRDWR